MKFSKYNMVVEMDYGLILYNSRKAKCVQIYQEPELSKFKELLETKKFDPKSMMVKSLYKRGYIVDDGVDEYAEAKKEIEELYQKAGKTLSILLYVTENCNFRCIYCPQKHVDKNFSPENWEALYKYIEKNIENKKYNFVRIDFFGGEPLLQLNPMMAFLEKLDLLKKKYKKVGFFHGMTTNAYLLTPKVYDKLVKHDVLSYQITVDGFAETHDKTRPLAGGGSSWEKIIENLKYINTRKDDALITFRTNISPTNVDTIDEFMKWSVETFDNKKFMFDFEPVAKFSDNVDEKLVKNWEQDDYMRDLETRIAQTPRTIKKESTPLVRLGFTCKCAKLGNFTIAVDGKVSKCEQTYGENFYHSGVLTPDGDFKFYGDIKDWEEGYETKYCPECIAYPLCAGRGCPVKKVLQPDKRPDCVYFEDSKGTVEKMDTRIRKFLMDKFPTVNPDDMDEKNVKKKIAEAKLKMKKKTAKSKKKKK